MHAYYLSVKSLFWRMQVQSPVRQTPRAHIRLLFTLFRTPMRRLAAGFTIASFIVAGLAACGGTDSPFTGVQSDIIGTWTLSTVSGAPLPVVVLTTATSKVEVVSDIFSFSVTGAYLETAVVRTTTNAVVGDTTYNDAGSYLFTSSSAARLKSSFDGTTQDASLAGGALTITASNGVFVYKR